MVQNKSLRLGELLCEDGLIEKDQLNEVLEIQRTDPRKLGVLLVEKGFVDDKRITEALASMFQIPLKNIDEVSLDPKVIRLIPRDLLQDYKVLPISLENKTLELATNDPLDVSALQDIQYKSGYTIQPVMASLQEIERHLQEYFDSLTNIASDSGADQQKQTDSTIISYVESIIRGAIKDRASDIHFEPQNSCMRVRVRIDGVLYERKAIDQELQRNVVSRIKIIAGMDVAETRRPQDGRASFKVGQIDYDLRISTLPNLNGENLVLRILSKQYLNRSFESLGMNNTQIPIVNSMMNKPYGLTLITGPTGAGKTTTLYTMMSQLNEVSKSIVSIEDPVEYELKGVNQTAISHQIGYTFVNAMRHILRHDPDIIMIGEVRDVETAEISIRAALTGHLVLSTIHTNTAAGAVTRLLEMNIEPFLISSAVNGIISQRLVRRLCLNCRQEYVPDESIITELKKYVVYEEGATLAHAGSCEKCVKTGFEGRIGLYEVLTIDDDIRSLILKFAHEHEINAHALQKGMISLQTDGYQKVIEKLTEYEEALRNVVLD